MKLDAQTDSQSVAWIPCYISSNGTALLLEQMLPTGQSILRVPPYFMVPGIYNFTDTIHSEILEGRESVTVNYSVDNSILIEMVPLAERKPNIDNALNLKWNVIAPNNSVIQMDFVEGEGSFLPVV